MTGPELNPLDDQLSRSFGERAGALGAVEPDVYDVRRRVGRQRNVRRAMAGACALVLVAGAGAAITWSAGRSDGPAAADGEATTVPAPAPGPTTTVPAAPIACGADQYTTTGAETIVHLGQPFTATAGQCLVGTAHASRGQILPADAVCTVPLDPTTGEIAPTTSSPDANPSGCIEVVECPNVELIPTTVVGGGSFPEVVQSFCAAGVTGGPINVQMGPTSTVSSNCPAGEITSQPGDVVLGASGLFELNVGQCIAATPQPLGTITNCTVVAGTDTSGYESSGTIVVNNGPLPVLTTTPGAPVPETGVVTVTAGGGCSGVISVSGPATTVEVPAPTSTVKN